MDDPPCTEIWIAGLDHDDGSLYTGERRTHWSLITKVAGIDASYAPYIYENSEYRKLTSIEYIEDRLSEDVSAGIWVDDILVGWGFTHDDDALGFLHVLADHRKHGYGFEILRSLVYLKKAYKKPVFCNIVAGNTIPINMVTRFGFKFDRRVSWLK
ncbi:MAG: GNAT family N-acetyltransferase [Bacteroidales bacterium]|nr:GNAT family N-acetyltransferase [Bacteroidales bacterium]